MSRYMLVAFTNPVDGRDADYNDWYSNTHLKDVTSIPGFKCAQRFKVQIPVVGTFAHRYVAFYEMDADSPEALGATLQALGSAKMEISDALDGAGSLMGVFEQFGPGVTSKAGEATGTYRLVIVARPQDGREGEYDQWYGNQHMPDLVGTPGVVWGARYKLHTPLMNEFPINSLALYGFEATTAEAAGATMKAIGEADYPKSDAAEPDKTRAGLFEACSALVGASKAPA